MEETREYICFVCRNGKGKDTYVCVGCFFNAMYVFGEEKLKLEWTKENLEG